MGDPSRIRSSRPSLGPGDDPMDSLFRADTTIPAPPVEELPSEVEISKWEAETHSTLFGQRPEGAQGPSAPPPPPPPVGRINIRESLDSLPPIPALATPSQMPPSGPAAAAPDATSTVVSGVRPARAKGDDDDEPDALLVDAPGGDAGAVRDVLDTSRPPPMPGALDTSPPPAVPGATALALATESLDDAEREFGGAAGSPGQQAESAAAPTPALEPPQARPVHSRSRPIRTGALAAGALAMVAAGAWAALNLSSGEGADSAPLPPVDVAPVPSPLAPQAAPAKAAEPVPPPSPPPVPAKSEAVAQAAPVPPPTTQPEPAKTATAEAELDDGPTPSMDPAVKFAQTDLAPPTPRAARAPVAAVVPPPAKTPAATPAASPTPAKVTSAAPAPAAVSVPAPAPVAARAPVPAKAPLAPKPAARPRPAPEPEPVAEPASVPSKLTTSETTQMIADARRKLADDDAEGAEELMRQLLQNDPRNDQALDILAHALIDQDRGGAAAAVAEKLVALRPRTVSYWLLLGDALLMKGDEAKAKAAWEKALELRPGDPGASQRLGL